MSNYKPQNDIHLQKVTEWENQNLVGLSAWEKCELYGKSIDAIIARANKTLSAITITVIIDRVFHQNKIIFPLMNDLEINFNNKILSHFVNNKKQQHSELLQTLRCTLIEILRVLGRITADILTSPLHNELMSVKAMATLKSPVKKKLKKVPEDK